MMQQTFDITAKDKDVDLALAESADWPGLSSFDPTAEPEPELVVEADVIDASTSSGGVRSQAWLLSVCVLLLASLRLSPDSTSSQVSWGAPASSAAYSTDIAGLAHSAKFHDRVGVKPVPTNGPATAEQAGAEPSSGKLISVALTRQVLPIHTVDNVAYYKSSYYGTISAGIPANDYRVVFDTGSGHLILPSRYCYSETCRAHRRYSRSESTSALDMDYDGKIVKPTDPRDQITVNFGTGEVTGIFIQEIVCLDSAGFQDWTQDELRNYVDQQVAEGVEKPLPVGCMSLRFIAATAMSEDPFSSFAFDGVLGLGLSGLSQAPAFNFAQVFAQTSPDWGVTQTNLFAVFLAEDGNAGSEITFGGWQKERLDGDIHWNDVLDPEVGHWMVRIKSLRVDGDSVDYCKDGLCKAVADTGTSLLGVPTDAFSPLYRLMWHPSPLDGLCRGEGPKLHIELDTFTVTMSPEDYAHVSGFSKAQVAAQAALPPAWGSPFSGGEEDRFGPTRFDLQCKPMLMSMDHPVPIGPKLFILGEPVLRKYYTVYDAENKRIGFGRSNHAGEVPEAKDDVVDDGSWFWEDQEQ